MAIERNKLDELFKQLAGELQNGVSQPRESLFEASPGISSENGSPPVRSFFGVWDSGNPHSADNDRIDGDLA